MKAGGEGGPGTLRRVLGFWDLVLFGIVCVTPIAPLPPFGIAEKLSGGHATLTIYIAMFAMLMTAISYGRMAGLYPQAGSAYTYVSPDYIRTPASWPGGRPSWIT